MAVQTLGLFGMAWERVGDEFRASDATVPVVASSRLTMRGESGATARLDVSLVVDWGVGASPSPDGGRFELEGAISLARSGDVWEVVATPAPALRRARVGRGNLPPDRLRVELGPLQHATSEAELRVVDGDLALATRDNLSSATVWLQDLGTDRHEMPVKLRTDRIVARVDLPHASVAFAPGSFAASVIAPYETRASDGVVDIRPVHEASWSSAACSAGLANVAETNSFEFLPGTDGPVRLLLNGELKARPTLFGAGDDGGNALLPALEAVDARLVFDLAANANTPRRPTLNALRLRPADTASGARFGLVCWAAIGEDDSPLSLFAPEATLRVRLGRAAASDPCNIPALVIDRMEADGSRLPLELHAARPSAWGLLRGGSVRVIGRHVTPSATAARLGVDLAALPIHPQLADAVWCLESLPVLERGDSEAGAVEQARYQIPLRDLTPGGSGDPHQTAVEPLHFSGPYFGWPLLDVEWLREGNWQFDTPPGNGPTPTVSSALTSTLATSNTAVADEDDPNDGADPISGVFQDNANAFGHPVRQSFEELNGLIASPTMGPRAGQGEQTHASLTRIDPVTPHPRLIGELVPDRGPSPAPSTGATQALSATATSTASAPEADLSPPRPLLGRHDLVQKYGSLMIPLDVPQEADGSEDLLADPIDLLPNGGDVDNFTGLYPHQLPGGSGNADFGAWFRMPLISNADPAADPVADVVKGFPVLGATTQAVVLAKNRRGVPLTDVLKRLPDSREGTRVLVQELIDTKQIDPDLLSPSWTGLILLRPGFQVLVPGLGNVLGRFLAEPFQYVAVTAQNPDQPREFPEVYATYRHEAEERPPVPDAILQAQDDDVEWELRLIDVRFRAREIVRFELSGFLTIRRLFRVAISGGPWEFEITGKYQSASDADNPTKKPRIVLEGAPKQPLQVDVNVGPILAGRLDRARVSVEGIDPDTPTGSGGRFEIDGAILLKPNWSVGVIGVDPNQTEVPIRRLGLSMGKSPRMSWDWPALEFPLVQREPLKIGPLTFRFLRLGMGGAEVLDGTIRIGGGDVESPRLPYAVARVELFKYPELGEQGGRTLGFDLVAAFDKDGQAPKFGLKGIDFSKLDIDLFRFLRLRIEHIEAQSAGAGSGTYLLIEGVKLDLLGKTIVEDLNIGLFQVGTERGFVAFLKQKIDLLPGLVTIDWLLLSYNLRLPRTTPLLLGLNDVGTAAVRQKIKEDIAEESPLAGQARGARWGFGFGCQILDGALRAKLLFVDGGSMGLMISSEFLEEALGFPGFAVGYLKGARPEDDRFWSEIPVPKVAMGPISFLGGVIGLEKFLRGGFTFDAGFPWLRDGIRAWDRGFGFVVGIYVGHAGFYFKYLPGTMPGPGGSGTEKTLLLAGGFGVAVGYGFCMTFAGVFTVYASIEVYAIIEGSVLLRYEMPQLLAPGGSANLPATTSAASLGSLEVVALQLRGVIGIVARGVGELNVWVLSARAEIMVFAEAESDLTWAKGQPAKIAYIFRAGYHVSASCRIGAGIFSWTFRFSLDVTFEFGGEIEI